MTAANLTALLAERVMHWSVAPDRFLIGGRRWIPRWRFRPLTNLEDAFRLLDKVATEYTLTAAEGRTFTAQVRVAERSGRASGKSKAMVISIAVARAIGLDLADHADSEQR